MDNKPPPNDPFWREFEKMAADLHREFAPGADIRHDDRVYGKNSKGQRQIDISIRQKIACYDILTVIDCKKRSRKVDAPEMKKFRDLREDVGAHVGVIISNKGFTKGA